MTINGKLTLWEKSMKQILFAAMIMVLAIGPAMAQETCASKAVDKNGKPLAGAALNCNDDFSGRVSRNPGRDGRSY